MNPDQEFIIRQIKTAYGFKYDDNDDALAEKLGISRGSVSNYRTGKRKIPLNIIFKTALDTKREFDWILTGHEPQADGKPKEDITKEIQYLKDIATLNKKLNERLEKEIKELNQKIKELEREGQMLKKGWVSGRRLGDPPELDVAALRKQSEKEK